MCHVRGGARSRRSILDRVRWSHFRTPCDLSIDVSLHGHRGLSSSRPLYRYSSSPRQSNSPSAVFGRALRPSSVSQSSALPLVARSAKSVIARQVSPVTGIGHHVPLSTLRVDHLPERRHLPLLCRARLVRQSSPPLGNFRRVIHTSRPPSRSLPSSQIRIPRRSEFSRSFLLPAHHAFGKVPVIARQLLGRAEHVSHRAIE